MRDVAVSSWKEAQLARAHSPMPERVRTRAAQVPSRLVRKKKGGLLSGFEQLVGKSGIGNRAGELQAANQRRKNRLRYFDVRIREHRFDVGNQAPKLSGERAPRRLRMSSDFRPERRRWTGTRARHRTRIKLEAHQALA